MSSIFNTGFVAGTQVFVYETEADNVQQIISDALTDYYTIPQATNLFVNRAGDTLTGNLDMNNNTIQNITTPLNDNDAANKLYVDTEITSVLLDVSGITQDISGINQDINDINQDISSINLNIQTIHQDINDINLDITDLQNDKLNKAGDTMTGILNMNNNKIENVLAPTNNNDASNKKYVDDEISNITVDVNNKVEKSGDIMSGSLYFQPQFFAPHISSNSGAPFNIGAGGLVRMILDHGGKSFLGVNNYPLNTEHAMEVEAGGNVLMNNNVGIGNTPATKLDVRGNIICNDRLRIRPENTSLDGIDTTRELVIFNDFNRTSFTRINDGNDILTFRNNGNVGINTTTPEAKLDVNGDILLKGNNKYLWFGANNKHITFANGGVQNESYFGIHYQHNNNGSFSGDRLNFISQRTQSNNTTDAQRNYITLLAEAGGDARVGINTTNPNDRMEIFTQSNTAGGLIISNSTTDNLNQSIDQCATLTLTNRRHNPLSLDRALGKIDFRSEYAGNGTGEWARIMARVNRNFSDSNSRRGTRLDFFTTGNEDGSILRESLRLRQNINNNEPNTDLIIGVDKADSRTTGITTGTETTRHSILFRGFRDNTRNQIGSKITSINRGGTTFANLNYGADLAFFTKTGVLSANEDNTVERMRITRDGNVGINNSNPLYHLDVNGQVFFSDTLIGHNAGSFCRRIAYSYNTNSPFYQSVYNFSALPTGNYKICLTSQITSITNNADKIFKLAIFNGSTTTIIANRFFTEGANAFVNSFIVNATNVVLKNTATFDVRVSIETVNSTNFNSTGAHFLTFDRIQTI
jgi:uncharacterized protein YoxC